jgi:hypothetical protein
MVLPFFFRATLILRFGVRKVAKNHSGETVLRLIQLRLATPSFENLILKGFILSFLQISLACQAQFAPRAICRFQFQKGSQLFIRAQNETPSIMAVCVSNPDRSSLTING